MTGKEWIVLTYKEGKVDMVRYLVEEINRIDIHGYESR